jgi:hypothetical protein
MASVVRYMTPPSPPPLIKYWTSPPGSLFYTLDTTDHGKGREEGTETRSWCIPKTRYIDTRKSPECYSGQVQKG